MENNLAFNHAFKVMGATQQLMVRSLINLIEMISTSSHRYAQDNSAFTDEAMSLMQKAAATREPESLRDLQKEWAKTCMKFSQSQTRATMGFVEQFGQQVLGTMANSPFTPPVTPSAPSTVAPSPAPATSSPVVTKAKATPKPKAEKVPVKPSATPKVNAAKTATKAATAPKTKEATPTTAQKATPKATPKTPRKNSTTAEKL